MEQYKKEIKLKHAEAVVKAKEKLIAHGFEIIPGAEHKELVKHVLDISYGNFRETHAITPIYACMPLNTEYGHDLMILCKLIVYTSNDQTFVTLERPTPPHPEIENAEIKAIAAHIGHKLKQIIDEMIQNDN